MSRPVLLDLFCGAGGASTGYHRAGFEVVGVDINPQPHYPFEFIQADAMFVLRHGFARTWKATAIHASPPCQHYANVTAWRGTQDDHPDLLDSTRVLLQSTGLPWIIENVPEAPVRPDYLLCGSMFGLNIRRHRSFEVSWPANQFTAPCSHHRGLLPFMHKGERAYADAMECHWMTNREAREAIPPVFTEYLGHQLIAAIEACRMTPVEPGDSITWEVGNG